MCVCTCVCVCVSVSVCERMVGACVYDREGTHTYVRESGRCVCVCVCVCDR